MRFPDLEVVRDAFQQLRPQGLEFYTRTGIKPNWTYGFVTNRHGWGSPKYEHLVKIIDYLETEKGVVFKADGTWMVGK